MLFFTQKSQNLDEKVFIFYNKRDKIKMYKSKYSEKTKQVETCLKKQSKASLNYKQSFQDLFNLSW